MKRFGADSTSIFFDCNRKPNGLSPYQVADWLNECLDAAIKESQFTPRKFTAIHNGVTVHGQTREDGKLCYLIPGAPTIHFCGVEADYQNLRWCDQSEWFVSRRFMGTFGGENVTGHTLSDKTVRVISCESSQAMMVALDSIENRKWLDDEPVVVEAWMKSAMAELAHVIPTSILNFRCIAENIIAKHFAGRHA